MSAVMEVARQNVSTLLVRLSAFEMLIPKSIVADILSWSKARYISERASSNRLHIGKYTWNEEILPLLSPDKILSSEVELDPGKRKVVVLRSVKSAQRFYYAIEVRGMPKPLIIDENSLRYAEDKEANELFAYRVRIGNRRLYIPNIEELEQLAISH